MKPWIRDHAPAALSGIGIAVGINLLLASVSGPKLGFLMIPAMLVLLPSMVVGFR